MTGKLKIGNGARIGLICPQGSTPLMPRISNERQMRRKMAIYTAHGYNLHDMKVGHRVHNRVLSFSTGIVLLFLARLKKN